MKQVVRAPTRGSNVLDLIITDMSRIYKQANIIPPIGKSDHSTVLWEPEISKLPQPARVSVTSRPMPDSAIRKFGQWITAYDWRPLLDATTAQDKTTTFYNIMQHQVDNHFPMRTRKRWVNDKIRHLIRRRQRAFMSEDEALWKSLDTQHHQPYNHQH